MKTLRMTTLTTRSIMDQHLSNPAVESAVDAYATRILRQTSPPEACIDESLGPYVTSMLRCALRERHVAIQSIDEFESLLELLEEHCSLTPDEAETALEEIATAVKTGIVPVDTMTDYGPYVGLLRLPEKMGPEKTSPQHVVAQDVHEFSFALEELVAVNNNNNNNTQENTTLDIIGRTPLKPDRLIPVDLLGALDDPSTPSHTKMEEKNGDLLFPPLGTEPKSSDVSKKLMKASLATTFKPSKGNAADLAAALFKPARPRQNSINEDTSPTLRSVSPPDQLDVAFEDNTYYQQQWESAVDMLLSINADLSDAAAAEATTMGGSDINVAQYIINKALAAPPVCRHMLSDGCYRSDCSFSHDMDGHTCLFWLRNRCGKGDSCRFRHGFSEKHLEGLNLDFMNGEQPTKFPTTTTRSTSTQPIPIATKNLVSHNLSAAFSAPQYNSPFASYSSGGFGSGSFGAFSLNQGSMMSSSWGESREISKISSSSQDVKQELPGFSFASIASKGYKDTSYYAKPGNTDHSAALTVLNPGTCSQQKAKFVKIPQDLWNPHVNRNASAFHITSPLERFKEVSKTVSRNDVIDLHFQSTKTFAVVLGTILPHKLRENGEAWIVTGSGHHVARQTHQKGGGALEMAVVTWLEAEDYVYTRGRDRNGHGGAVLVKQR